MRIAEFLRSTFVELPKERWRRVASYLRQERIRKRIKILLWIVVFLLFPELTITWFVGRWAYRRYQKRKSGANAAMTREELEDENRRLRSAKWELEERVSALGGGDSRAFIAYLNKIYDAFDVEISRINGNDNLTPYAKAQRIKDWENLRDIQITKTLEPQK
jgi:hypothetical protein